MRDNQLLDNRSVSTFPWQGIDAVSDELFEVVISIRLAWKFQKGSYIQLQFSSPQFTTGFRRVQSSPRAPDKTLICVVKSYKVNNCSYNW
jgi:hypothetical protein